MKAVILTKSRMNSHGVSGVCTTAYDLESERILRFVSNQEGAPIGNPHNSRYECLDVVDVNILKDCPIGPQTENVLVDQTSFKKIGKYTGDLSELFDEIYNIYCFDRQYMFDIPEVFSYKLDSVDRFNHSVEIIRVSDLVLTRSEWGSTSASFFATTQDGKRNFRYYTVTDTRFELRNSPESEKKIGNAYIVVSIPYTPHKKDGCFYKFVAAIYPI